MAPPSSDLFPGSPSPPLSPLPAIPSNFLQTTHTLRESSPRVLPLPRKSSASVPKHFLSYPFASLPIAAPSSAQIPPADNRTLASRESLHPETTAAQTYDSAALGRNTSSSRRDNKRTSKTALESRPAPQSAPP